MSLPRVRKGEPITATLWNQLVDAVNRGQLLHVAGAEMKRGAFGTVLRVPGGGGEACIAKITTEVQKATSITRPGKGKLQRYTSIDMTTTPATIANLTGVDEDCVSINQDYKVKVDTDVIAVRWIGGVWLVASPDSCASLI